MMKRMILMGALAVVTWVAAAAEVVWFDGTKPVSYEVKQAVDPVVNTALRMFCDDLRQVTGREPVASPEGTIQIIQQAGTDDGFRIYVRDGHIIVEGHGGRGTAYGLLELSRMAGVSPWVWWGDVVPEKKTRLTISSDFRTEQTPSVALRGIFLNDEDWSLRPWSSKHYEPADKGTIGPQTYRRIFELLLRLRANAVWPAMHEGTTAFFQTVGAKAMADSCGIIIGTSHCEPLLRNNVGEWDKSVRGAFNYRTNRAAVHQYWTERLKEVSGSKDNMFTIGMRGIHDSSMEGYTTDDEKLAGLQQVIDDQQNLLRQYVGDPAQLTQVFVPYKEVLGLYERGLRVPDYVTLMWCDDNYGYMTRLSDAREQRRSGGAGLYYHLSYWGRPHDYLWLTTTQPGLIYNELREAYDHHVRRLWIANVHDPKVAGYDLELFLDMAWNIDCVSAETLGDHYRAWLCRQFGEAVGNKLYPSMRLFSRLNAERRPEFMGWTQVELDKKKYPRGLSPVTQVALTVQEARERLAAYDSVCRTVEACRQLLDTRLGDAYFAAVEYPVQATAAMNRKMLSDAKTSHQAYETIQQLTVQYNEMLGGKWRGLMDAAPRRLPVFGDVRAQLAEEPDSERVLVRAAAEWDKAGSGAQPVDMLGYSMRAVRLPKGATLTYRFTVDADADYTLTTALVPTQPLDGGDLRYSVSIDGGAAVTHSLKEPFRSERWKENVLRQQAQRRQRVHLTAGRHTLTLRALDDHVVVDQWMLDAPKNRRRYALLDRVADQPFDYTVKVPDGNYRVTVTLGSKRRAGQTVVRAESRRHFVDLTTTKKGQLERVTFTVNKHSPRIDDNTTVRLKPREWTYRNWDDSLTLSFCGPAPAVYDVTIEPDTTATTVFLCGNSTVVDQENEPWASWGQMITRWFQPTVAIANYAESGLSATTFLAQGRLDKILTQLRAGDYVVCEFGHNDEKEHRAGDGAWYSYARNLKIFADRVRERGGHVIFVTPTARRFFNDDHRTLRYTHGDYPEAMRTVAQREQVPLVELNGMTRTFYETLGEEGSKRALVHYPANTFADQPKALADNTHFNPFGAWEVAKMVVMGLKQINSPLADHLRPEWQDFSPTAPDDPMQFLWYPSQGSNIVKPDGN